MEKIKNFVYFELFLEEDIKNLFLDYLENHEDFISVNYHKSKSKLNVFWAFNIIFLKSINKVELLKRINFFKKQFNLKELKYSKSNSKKKKNRLY